VAWDNWQDSGIISKPKNKFFGMTDGPRQDIGLFLAKFARVALKESDK
jgi:hypothetical protein